MSDKSEEKYTYLNLALDDEMIVCSFHPWKGGADEWPLLVDTFRRCVREAADRQGVAVGLPPRNGKETLGRGAPVVLSPKVFVDAYSDWHLLREVRRAMKQTVLRVNWRGLPKDYGDIVRRKAKEVRQSKKHRAAEEASRNDRSSAKELDRGASEPQ